MDNPNHLFHMPDLHRISLFIGAYGSGKSEISVNFACWLAGRKYRTVLCDLDIINPYYRSSDAKESLESAGIRVISPPYAGTNVDVPAVPGEVNNIFDNPDVMAVMDIGGEDLGARVIASFRTRLLAQGQDTGLYMVVNPYRPFTDKTKKIEKMAGLLADAAKMPISGLIHNPNLLEHGSADLILESWPIIREAAGRLDIPVVFAAALDTCVPAGWGGKTPQGIPLLRLLRNIRYADQI